MRIRQDNGQRDTSFFGEKVYYLPAKDPLFYSADVHGNAIAKERMKCLERIIKGQGGTFVMTIDAVMDRVVPLTEIKKYKMVFKIGDVVEETGLAKRFTALGYEKTAFVEAAGEFAIRGGIIDIYPYTEDCPYRMELWGDEIDSIRSFDAQSQRSIETVEKLILYPATEIVLEENRIRDGLLRIEKDYKSLAGEFHKKFETEKEVRLKKEFSRIREELSELHMLIGIEGYLPYFYEKTW